jgi:hypothetical protein
MALTAQEKENTVSDEGLKFGYWRKILAEQEAQGIKAMRRVEEYNGEKNFMLVCTQRSDCTAHEQAKGVEAWCKRFQNEQLPLEKVWVTTRISQKILDALCCQRNLNGLWIKWGVYTDLSALENLANLEYLHLGGGAGLNSIEAIRKLPRLKALQTACLFGIHDYSLLAGSKNLIDLSIYGDGLASMKKITLNSLGFLEDLPQLQRLSLCMTKIEDHSYLPITKLKNLKFLGLPNDRDLDKDMEKIRAMNAMTLP